MLEEGVPKSIRVSVGSAIVLGLEDGMIEAEPMTVYMLTYRKGKCSASCAFCPQSRISAGRADMLSRVVWPVFPTEDVITRIAKAFKKGKIQRVCIQALNYPGVQEDIIRLARLIRSLSDVPVSISCQPLSRLDFQRMVQVGVSRVSIALDAVTKEIFGKVKGPSVGGPYAWERHFKALREAVAVFGRGSVTTHLIAGLGENEKDFVRMIQKCIDLGVYPSLFAFTPVPGTIMARHPPPPIDYYRRIQLAHYLITRRIRRYEDLEFKDGRLVSFGLSSEQLLGIVRSAEPFMTSGCPGCNRPYYNERPGGPIYNYPKRPTAVEIAEIEKVLCL